VATAEQERIKALEREARELGADRPSTFYAAIKRGASNARSPMPGSMNVLRTLHGWLFAWSM
jgi:hypothetical protein